MDELIIVIDKVLKNGKCINFALFLFSLVRKILAKKIENGQEPLKKGETPLSRQFNQIKAKYPGAILLFRVGDFYETFGEDAVKASKILGIGTTEHNWKQYKKIKSGERTNLHPEAAKKITCIYGSYQQTKARKRITQLSVAGKLWSDDDFHCLKMDEFCGDLASSLDKDAKMRARKPFQNWRE